jgi:integrase
MNVLRSILGFAYDRVLIEANHALGIPKLTPSGQSRAENIWTADIRQQLFAHAKPCLRRLCLFALYTGARQSDICRLTWANISADGWLSFQPGKTSTTTQVWVHLPIFALEPLDALLRALPRTEGGPILLTDDRPRKWTPENIKRQMRLTKQRRSYRRI